MPPRYKPSKTAAFFHKVQYYLNPENLFKQKPLPAVARSIYINQPLPVELLDKKGRVPAAMRYSTSQVVTSKYTILTFLPKNLFEQFRRIANIFFLGIAILQFFPKFSTISPGLVILPLLAVLLITALKDGYEDIKRHQSDRNVNHSVVHTLVGPNYVNHNPMGAKAKTFVKGVRLPQSKKKRAKQARDRAGFDQIVRDEHHDIPVDDATAVIFPGEDLRGIRSRDQEVAEGIPEDFEHDVEAVDTSGEIGWKKTIWEDVKVGDFIKIYNNEGFPADVVICATSEEEDVAYIETKNLDGETNLKSRHAVPELAHLRSALSCSTARFRIDCEPPEVNMFRLNAAVVAPGPDGVEVKHPINLETSLLRGCVLRNTAWVIGIVMFTGADTKIVANSGGTPSKRSKVERQMNPQVLFSLLILGLAGMVCAIVNYFHEKKYYRLNSYWTLYDDRSGDNPSINGLFTFLNSLITFQNIIPISLYISIEFVRTAQAAFIYYDEEMTYEKTDTKTLARSWNLADDLGQIEYIFSDKTGTLTQNAMIFQQCSIGHIIYKGDGKLADLPPVAQVNEGPGMKPTENTSKSELVQDSSSGSASDTPSDAPKPKAKAKDDIPRFHSDELDRVLENEDSEQYTNVSGFFTNLALCHTALASEDSNGMMEYMAQSPDEAALVQAAADVGFVFKGKDRNILRLKTPHSDGIDEYELLNVLEFTSARKRMSVILRKLDDEGKLFLLIKGADNVIFERLAPGLDDLKEQTNKDLEFFANEGLRTLCLGYRMISEQEFAQWSSDYHNASTSLDDREGKMAEVSAQIEHSLVLLGATAIEDKLQDGVPEAIADLKRAGIKVWVATGDKLETAISIGYSTNLLTKDSNLIIVRGGAYGTPNSAYDQLKAAIDQFFGPEVSQDVNYHPPDLERTTSRMSGFGRPSFQQRRSSHRRSAQLKRTNTGLSDIIGRNNGDRPGGYSLVIEGSALTHTFAEEWTEDLLLQLSTRCNTVICCRVSPLQKAQIVRLIKVNIGAMTLAIGDGANDVSMIQAADVGVGISGEEGLQAVNSSDYAIAQFRYLTRLLLVHGHWCYVRNSNMILNFFFKNIVGVAVLFFFQIYCTWSTTYAYDYVYLLLWNVVWTIAPVIGIGLFDRDLNDDILVALPELYRQGREGRYFGFSRYIYFVFEGVLQSAIVFFFINYTYDVTTARSDGFDVFLYEFSTVMVIGAVMVCNEFHAITTHSFPWWIVGACFIGPVLLWSFVAVYSALPPNLLITYSYGNNHYLFHSALFWFGTIFVSVIGLLPKYLLNTISQMYRPTDIDIMRAVRKQDKGINVADHPALGARKAAFENAAEPEEEYPASNRRSVARDNVEANPRESMTSMRPLNRTATTGSQIDMATGRVTPGGGSGYNFAAEEGGGVAGLRRSQSRLSGVGSARHMSRQDQLRAEAGLRTGRNRSGTLSSLRSRAGSIFMPNRKG
ncbi:phospholipid-translocating atpase [Phaffia rhodozyma]|uniref:Phospholipid-transporting ATPase n=1 Tax=Phaffia rhodozyma TaxID=264483 RepID=A0A0F7SG86_PHARH|nr:phospholipid-translocating atpase [Phaffia rhodozyma]